MVCTPLFLKADPQITGKIFSAMVALRMPARISSFGDAVAFDEFFEQRVVELGDRLDHLLAVFLGLLHQVRWNFGTVSYSAPSVSSRQITRLHFHQVDDALELVFRADRQLDRPPAGTSGGSTMVSTEW